MDSEELPADEICQMYSVELRLLYTFLFKSLITPFGKKHTTAKYPVISLCHAVVLGFYDTSPS